MKNPPHPGKAIRIECMEPFGLTVTETAKVLGVSRPMLSQILNEKANITPEMAIRLSKAFGSTPQTWLQMQLSYDLARAMAKAKSIRVRRFSPRK